MSGKLARGFHKPAGCVVVVIEKSGAVGDSEPGSRANTGSDAEDTKELSRGRSSSDEGCLALLRVLSRLERRQRCSHTRAN